MFRRTCIYPLSLRRFLKLGAAILLFVSALLLAGCPAESGASGGAVEGFNQDLVGKWTQDFGDYYIISESRLMYYNSDGSIAWGGDITAAVEFTGDDGVIIIKYDDDHRQYYYERWNDDMTPDLSSRYPVKGDYIGIYYNDLVKTTSANLCVAFNIAMMDGSEQKTSDAAVAEFTQANYGTYAGNQPPYAWSATE